MKAVIKTTLQRLDAHPSNLSLEEFAADDEGRGEVADHIARCALCRSYVVELVIAAYAARAWQEAADNAFSLEPS